MTDIVDLCSMLRAVIETAPAARRAALAAAFDEYLERYPELWALLHSPSTPQFFYHFVAEVDQAAHMREPASHPTKQPPRLHVVGP
jgi:hypothetical protein